MTTIRFDVDLEELLRVVQTVRAHTEKYATDLPYYRMLVALREELKQEHTFYPVNCCIFSSIEVRRVLGRQFGIVEMPGVFSWDGFIREGEGKVEMFESHMWNYDANRNLYIDLTLDQFYCGFPCVSVIPVADARFLRRDDF